MIPLGLVMLVGQAIAWWLAAEGLNDVLMGDFYDAADRVFSLGGAGSTFSDADIEFFESLDAHLPASALIRFALAVAIALVSYVLTQIGWLRTVLAARDGHELPTGQVLADSVALFPRTVGNGLVVWLPILIVAAGLGVLMAALPPLALLLIPILVVLVIVWSPYGAMTMVACAVAPRGTSVLRSAFRTVERRRTHAFKCMLMALLPAMVVSFGGGVLGQVGLLLGVAGYFALSALSSVVQGAVQTASLGAMYISLQGEVDEALSRPVA